MGQVTRWMGRFTRSERLKMRLIKILVDDKIFNADTPHPEMKKKVFTS
jgi:hypothetical protein